MPSPSFTLRRATVADAPAIVETYFSAFSHDLISLKVFPRDDPTTHHFWLSMIQEEIPDPLSHFLVITTDPKQEGKQDQKDQIIAFAKWNSPRVYPDEPLPAWPTSSDHALANEFFGTLNRKKRDIMGERMYWFLELIGTRPEWQGKGAAGMLIRWGLERADEEAKEAYLEGSPEGVPVYRHFGFEEVDRFAVLGGAFEEVFMVREGRVVAKEEESEKALKVEV